MLIHGAAYLSGGFLIKVVTELHFTMERKWQGADLYITGHRITDYS